MAALRKAGFRQGDNHGPIRNDLVHFSFHADGDSTGGKHRGTGSGGRRPSAASHHSRRRHRH